MVRSYLMFWWRMIRFSIQGDRRYYGWIAFLLTLMVPGLIAYGFQFSRGLSVTNMSDQVSWGAYIANFTFVEGVAAAAVLLVVPAFIYDHRPTREVVILGELLAVAAVVMCLLFIMVDLGRPDHFLHILPGIGRLNLRHSVLAWDVVTLNGYLILNLHISGYTLYMKYLGRQPTKWVYLPMVFISIFWAASILTVTAFLYSGLGGRPFWNSAILAPRFLVSAFAGGPAILTLVFRAMQRFTLLKVDEGLFDLLKKIVAITMPINLFLLACELFKEFYTDTQHVAAAKYLYFGLEGGHMLQPYIWGSLFLNVTAMVIFVTPRFRDRQAVFLSACVMAVIGIWIEKGMGLIIPGFVPSPLGDIVEYTPSIAEFFVSLGIWSAGALVYTLLAKVAIGVLTGRLTALSNR